MFTKKLLTIEAAVMAVLGYHLWTLGKLDWVQTEYLIFVSLFASVVLNGILFKWMKQI